MTRPGTKPPAARARLRAPLKWTLAGTFLATIASLLWPTRGVVAVQERSGGALSTLNPVRAAATAASTAFVAERPISTLSNPDREAAGSSAPAPFDPFIGVLPPPPPAPVAPPVAPAPPPPPPAPPAQDYRFLGRVTGPDGVEQVLLSRGDSMVPISVGTVLDNGYKVEAISADTVSLLYPQLGVRASITVGTNR